MKGIGSLFYLSYALDQHPFPEADLLWAVTAAVIVISTVVHGLAAKPLVADNEQR